MLVAQIVGLGVPDAVIVTLEGTPGVNGKVGALVKTGGCGSGNTDSETRSKTPSGAFNGMLVET